MSNIQETDWCFAIPSDAIVYVKHIRGDEAFVVAVEKPYNQGWIALSSLRKHDRIIAVYNMRHWQPRLGISYPPVEKK